MPRPNEGIDRPEGLGSGYAALQLSKALTTAEGASDPSVRARARERISRWLQVVSHALEGSATYGSRVPFADVPPWVTLEVMTGGFATGRMLAGGELTCFERELAASLKGIRAGQERLDLNTWHLTDEGIEALQQRLQQGTYRIDLPEEAALPVVAWLLGRQRFEEARSLVGTIAPFFDRLRFFPSPAPERPAAAAQVNVFSAGDVTRRLAHLAAQPRLARQKQAIEIRLPLYDEAIALFLQTYSDGWPCRLRPQGWSTSAHELSLRTEAVQRDCPISRSARKNRKAELFELLRLSAADPSALTQRQIGRIRRIVDDFVLKHGQPGSERHREHRERQRGNVAAPAHHRIGQAVAARLAAYPVDEGIADFTALSVPITAEEADTFALAGGAELPPAIRRRLERCRRGSMTELIEHGVITSGDTIAKVLPASTAEIRGTGFADPVLRRLYAASYRAFRQRRSLLLLDLQGQVRLHELPWISVIEGDRKPDAGTMEAAHQALTDASAVAVTAFPYAILPNKLLQELRALASSAQQDLPFVDEIAADIFMGEFTNTFVEAARRAARTVSGTLYAGYYGIDTDALEALPDKPEVPRTRSWQRRGQHGHDALATLAARRAGVSLGTWHPATNGMLLEQAQILTTHNLALLFDGLGLKSALRADLHRLALRCFEWICARQQMRIADWHARLIMVKNTAYAWRQMIFYLSMLDAARRDGALEAVDALFRKQPAGFQGRFMPAMQGLRLAAQGQRLPQHEPGSDGARVFCGWSIERHWLLPRDQAHA